MTERVGNEGEAVPTQRSSDATGVSSGPRLTVFLVNQSASMGAEMKDYGISIAEGVADVLNLYLQKLAQKREADGRKGPSEYESANFGVAVMGYGSEAGAVETLFRTDAGGTWASPTRTRSESSTISSDKSLSTFSTWIDPIAGAEGAPFCKALAAATEMVESWIPSHKLAPSPRVINITDGTITDGDPTYAAARLGRLSTFNGPSSIWTCHISPDSTPSVLLFPNDEGLLPHNLAPLYRSTSPLPQDGLSNLLMEFPEVSKISGARAGVFNSDLRTVVRFVAFVARLPLP